MNPDPEALPLVFRYGKATKADGFRFTTAASYVMNNELLNSNMLKMVWRIGYSSDEEAYSKFAKPIFSEWTSPNYLVDAVLKPVNTKT